MFWSCQQREGSSPVVVRCFGHSDVGNETTQKWSDVLVIPTKGGKQSGNGGEQTRRGQTGLGHARG